MPRSPVKDPLRTPVDRGGPIPQSGRRPSRPCHARDPPLLPTCITMHRRSPAKLPDLPRSTRVDDMRHSAAYDWRRIHSATPQRNALTCRDGCAFLSGEGSAAGRSWGTTCGAQDAPVTDRSGLSVEGAMSHDSPLFHSIGEIPRRDATVLEHGDRFGRRLPLG